MMNYDPFRKFLKKKNDDKNKKKKRKSRPGRSFRPSETAAYTAGNDYKTAKILP
jgi:hypothetical protein